MVIDKVNAAMGFFATLRHIIDGFHYELSCCQWWSSCSYQNERIMLILFMICSSLVFDDITFI
jgi:hypothetical protein